MIRSHVNTANVYKGTVTSAYSICVCVCDYTNDNDDEEEEKMMMIMIITGLCIALFKLRSKCFAMYLCEASQNISYLMF